MHVHHPRLRATCASCVLHVLLRSLSSSLLRRVRGAVVARLHQLPRARGVAPVVAGVRAAARFTHARTRARALPRPSLSYRLTYTHARTLGQLDVI